MERFQDNTRWMIEFSVQRPCSYGSPGDEMRLFLTEDGYQAALVSQKRREIKIKRYARVIEGHVLDFKMCIRDRAMMETADSVRQYGVLVPAIARPDRKSVV